MHYKQFISDLSMNIHRTLPIDMSYAILSTSVYSLMCDLHKGQYSNKQRADKFKLVMRSINKISYRIVSITFFTNIDTFLITSISVYLIFKSVLQITHVLMMFQQK